MTVMKGYGFLTDQITQPFDTIYKECDRYIVIRTDKNPDYMYGNYIYLNDDELVDNKKKLNALWIEEFGDEKPYRLFQFESATPTKSPIKWGHQWDSVNCDSVMVLHELRSIMRSTKTFRISRFQKDEEWSELLKLMSTVFAADEKYRDFLMWRLAEYRKLIDTDNGEWWGLWFEESLVSSAGIFWRDNDYRFQECVTHQKFQNLGFNSNVLSSIITSKRAGTSRFFIVASEDSKAYSTYSKLGFISVSKVYNFFENVK